MVNSRKEKKIACEAVDHVHAPADIGEADGHDVDERAGEQVEQGEGEGEGDTIGADGVVEDEPRGG